MQTVRETDELECPSGPPGQVSVQFNSELFARSYSCERAGVAWRMRRR